MRTPFLVLLIGLLPSPPSRRTRRATARRTAPPSAVTVGGSVPELTFYVDSRSSQPWDTWIYHESNGVFLPGAGPHENLRRGGPGPLGHAEWCTDVGDWAPDTWIY